MWRLRVFWALRRALGAGADAAAGVWWWLRGLWVSLKWSARGYEGDELVALVFHDLWRTIKRRYPEAEYYAVKEAFLSRLKARQKSFLGRQKERQKS